MPTTKTFSRTSSSSSVTQPLEKCVAGRESSRLHASKATTKQDAQAHSIFHRKCLSTWTAPLRHFTYAVMKRQEKITKLLFEVKRKKNNSRLVSGCPWTITRYTCGLNIGGRILHARKRVVDRSQQLNRVGAGGWGENVESSVSFFVVMGNRLTSIQTGNGTEGKMRIREARWRQNCEIHWRSILKIFLDVFFKETWSLPNILIS